MTLTVGKTICESPLDYTKRWIKAIDRGGLFTVSDDVYTFFKSIEIKIRRHLNLTRSEIDKEKTLKDIVGDMDVQFFWSFVSIDLDEDVAEQLLEEIVRFWQTIRGFSAVAAYMEDYKTCTAKKTKKSVGLRKRLKRKKLNLEQLDEAEP